MRIFKWLKMEKVFRDATNDVFTSPPTIESLHHDSNTDSCSAVSSTSTMLITNLTPLLAYAYARVCTRAYMHRVFKSLVHICTFIDKLLCAS